MKKILYLTNVIRRFGIMAKTLQKQQGLGLIIGGECSWISEDLNWDDKWEKKIAEQDLVIIDYMGSGLDTLFLQKLVPYLQQQNIPHYGDLDGTKAGVYVKGLSSEEINTICQYFKYGGESNYENLWLYLEQCLLGHYQFINPPNPSHWCGIFYPGDKVVYTTLEDYLAVYDLGDKPYVGIVFYREEWVWQDLEYQSALIKALEQEGLMPICVFTNGMPDEDAGMPSLQNIWEKFFCKDGKALIHVLINTMKFSMTASKSITIEYFHKLGIPILQAYTIIAPYEQWVNSLEGLNSMEVSISAALPEFDGIIHGIPIAAKVELANGDIRYKPIADRIQLLAKKAKNWVKLRRKPNAEKRVGIIFHNYPPKNSNIGSAFALDSIESVRRLLARMAEEGYKITNIPTDTKDFIDILTSYATNDVNLLSDEQILKSPTLTGEEYLSFFKELPREVQEKMIASWGEPPGELLNFYNKLLIPGFMNGNVFITMQPTRGFTEDPGKLLHDPASPPPHQYLGFYYWLSNIWQADAVVHVGTHGSQEWLPGKNAGLGNTCYPSITMEALPNLYPYLISITGEGIQAKRRGFATLIEYLPAPQTMAGLYDELLALEALAEEYLHFQKEDGSELEKLVEEILRKVQEANLGKELPYNEGEDFELYLGKLHNYLTELKHMPVQTSLHILGQPPVDEELVEYIELLLKVPNEDLEALPEILAKMQGCEFYHLLEHSQELLPNGISKGLMAEGIIKQALAYIRVLGEQNYNYLSPREILEKLNYPISIEDENLLEDLDELTDFIVNTLYPNIQATSQEMDYLLRGLDGEYIEPGPSGAPSSGGAMLLPTGRNFYGVDPRLLPTLGAWILGMEVGDRLIQEYINLEGVYPENIGIVLWSGASMRTHGQSVAEMLYLMGVKPVWQKGNNKVIGLEIIPLEELKRPRIDTTARISGLFRDTLPNLAQLLDDAVLMVSELEENAEDNYIRKHILEDSQALIGQGMKPEDAWRQASFRVFGDEQGTYGAGVSTLLDSQNWEDTKDLAEVYIRWGAHAYGGEYKGVYLPELFRKRMASLDITVQNTDNREVNMISCDDYVDYHGGMIATVTALKGEAPKSFHGDFSNKKRITMRSVEDEAKMIFRSENINPKFIEGMMKHDYKGAADLVKRMNYTFQWDAVAGIVEDWMYDAYVEKYICDAKVQAWLKEVNPWALQRMVEILLEANQRKMWDASAEILDKLRGIYLEADGDIESRM